jgi:hypothetical protein
MLILTLLLLILISIESGEMLDPQPLSFSEDVLILTTTLLGEMMIITSKTVGTAKHDQFSINYSSAHRCSTPLGSNSLSRE